MSATANFNYPLYNYAVGWFRRNMVNPVTFLAPLVKVDDQLGTFKRFNQGNIFEPVETRRAKYQGANMVDTDAEDISFKLEDHSLKTGVADDELSGNKDAADMIARKKMNTLLGKWRTSFIKQGFDFFRANVTAESDVGAWGSASCEAITQLRAQVMDFATQNGIYPNRILFGTSAWDLLDANAETQDKIAYNSAKTLTVELLLKLIGLSDIGQDVTVIKGIFPIATARSGPGVPFRGKNILGSEVWLTYAEDGMSEEDPSGLKTLSTGGEDMIEALTSYYDDDADTTWYKAKMRRQFVLSAPSCIKRINVTSA